MDSSLRVYAAFAMAAFMYTTALATERPIGLSGKMVSRNRADLYWFQSNVNDTAFAYDDGDSDCPVSVIEEDRDNRVAVKFDQFVSPVYVLGGYVYVLNYDPEPAIPGTPLSPIEVSLHLDGGAGPGEMIAGPVVVQADGVWTEEGQWLFAGFQNLYEDDGPLWVQVRWPSSNPFMPKIGGDGNQKDFMSVVGYFDGAKDVWINFSDYDIMIRLALLLNSGQVTPSSDDDNPDSFHVHWSDDVCSDTCDCLWIASNYDMMLHRRMDVLSSACCFCVTSWSDDSESEPSELLQLHGLPGDAVPAIVDSSQLDLSVTTGECARASVPLSSQSDRELHYMYTSSLDTSDLEVEILGGVGSLAPFASGSISFFIDSNDLMPGEFIQHGRIGFRDTLEVYQSVDINLHIAVNSVTSAAETTSRTPMNFILGQNYPNPFNSRTVIEIQDADSRDNLSLDIFDLLGRRVVCLRPSCVSSEVIRFEWDTRDEGGDKCASGLYFYKVSDRNSGCRKMLLLK